MSEHATIANYRRGCHCGACRSTWAAYHRAYRARRMAKRLAAVRVIVPACDLELERRKARSYARHDAWGEPV